MASPQQDDSSRKTLSSPSADYVRYSGIGVQFAATMGFFGYLGYKIDLWLGLLTTFPVFLVAGVTLGMALGIYRLKLQFDSPPSDSDTDS